MEIEEASQSSVVIDITPTGRKSAKLFWTTKQQESQLQIQSGFKKDVNNFLELKNASGFWWKEETWEVTAP
ncbi:hypothetical protein VP01_805g2 [Puccinia sorghi]|uniref:Uncharacterized protein n=1 Tax=Puccinia sorghi TaxID=27349 RepID=A0A0L6UAB9_9BASI|nr:hypothetical protein VP01_805g2 [Puccinia sorghi]